MMTLNIALCDDDKAAIESESELICDLFDEKGVGYRLQSFQSSKELLKSEVIYDIVFLDIEMEEPDGIDLARQLSQKKKDCYIFFLTNYSVYLDKAFDVNAIRYLTKPVDRQRLSSGIDRVLEKMDDATKVIPVVNFSNKISVEIPVASIIYIENTGRRTHIVSTSYDFIADELFSSMKNKIEKEVDYFAMPHQSYFVNLRYVTGHNKQSVTMSYAGRTYEAYVSRRKYSEFDRQMFVMASVL